MRHFFSALSLAVVLCLTAALDQTGAQAQEVIVAEPSANDLHEFTRLLSDARIQGWIAAQANDAEANSSAIPLSLREQLMQGLAHVRARLDDIALARQALPNAPSLFAEQWGQKLDPSQQVRGLTFVMIFLFVGAGLEWLYRQYTNPIKLRIELRPITTLRSRFTAAGVRSLIIFGGLAVFAQGSIGTFAAFKWPPALEGFVLSLLVVIFSIRAIRTILVLFLAPSVPELRLLPVSNAMAKNLSLVLLCLSGAYIIAATFSDIFVRVTGDTAGSPESLSVMIAMALASLLATFVALVAAFGSIAKHQNAPLTKTQRMWRLYLIALAIIAFVTLVLDQTALMWTVVLLGLLVPSMRLLRAWVDSTFDQAAQKMAVPGAWEDIPNDIESEQDNVVLASQEGLVEEIEEEDKAWKTPPPPHPSESYRAISQRLVRFLALFAIGVTIALIWDFHVFERAASPTVAGRIMALIIDSIVAFLIADLIWVWASSAIDRRLDAYVPPEPGTAPGPEARMATLLPLLRVALMVTLLAMVIMSVLTSLGVNVAPLIAGAGVVGVAIGFGAQSLVKDVFSGIFFLIDDAFRVGEYVEIDNLRGTVERISIRSLQIRHHRGAVHTLPFGELKSLTNHSRDWVIMKLEFRVPFDTDLKLVKKLIKTIGATMKEHEEYGSSILETLKSQGVRRMEEFNMVVGVKFMTRPGEQWLVRRDAYQMVRDAFDANGIRMAERNVKVEVAGAENLTEEERHAVAGAAQQAIERQAGPPAPVPDEP
ncbi:MAG: mechanosensitive ion channel family protein [Sulfitobacter sp.]